MGYLGSSNLTLSGLSHQGELNIDVVDSDACEKLEDWFEDRWNDRWCIDISKVILLSVTPYNKTYLNLSNQLRLFVDETEDLGIRPEQYIKKLGGETEFIRKHQSGVRTLPAFEQSEYIDDWRELMRRYLVRRTRSFITENYAETDPETQRKFLSFPDSTRSYFPTRLPKTMQFEIDDQNPNDTYAQLYSDSVVDVISNLKLARYGLANYIVDAPSEPLTEAEQQQLEDLSRGGQRLMGFCRTNLFKRLESSGQAFIQSVDRHILRNYIFLHAIENDEPLPIGSQNAEMLDSRFEDRDSEDATLILDASGGGQLRRPSGARFRTYEWLKDYASAIEGTLLETRALRQVIEAIYRHPLRQTATDTLNRQLRSGISNEDLAALVIDLWETDRLCIVEEERQTREPQIVCSLGLRRRDL